MKKTNENAEPQIILESVPEPEIYLEEIPKEEEKKPTDDYDSGSSSSNSEPYNWYISEDTWGIY